MLADVAGRHYVHRERQHARRSQPLQMPVHSLWLPLRVRENCTVWHWLDPALRPHQGQCGRLPASAQRENTLAGERRNHSLTRSTSDLEQEALDIGYGYVTAS